MHIVFNMYFTISFSFINMHMCFVKTIFFCLPVQRGQHHIQRELSGNPLHRRHDEDCGQKLLDRHSQTCSKWGRTQYYYYYFFLFLLMLTGHVYSCIKYIKWFIVFILLLQIFESNKTCEIDPVKLKEGDNVEVNKVRWCLFFGWILIHNLAIYISCWKLKGWLWTKKATKTEKCTCN